MDLVVHAAGPFQCEEKCTVLEAAISTKVCLDFFFLNIKNFIYVELSSHVLFLVEQTAYVDVCDDTDYAWKAKCFHKKAVAAGVPAITTGGIYPGVSNGVTICILLLLLPKDYTSQDTFLSLVPDIYCLVY